MQWFEWEERNEWIGKVICGYVSKNLSEGQTGKETWKFLF